MSDKLKNYLNLTWLRPENALFNTFKSTIFEDIKFESPSIDISCGDGLAMFIHLGGVLSEEFDKFWSTRAEDFKHDSFIDIYDTSEHFYPVIIKKPITTIDCGTDWKQSQLDKAAKLFLYKKLILHDNNKLPLPFPDDYFKTIHSNSVYWVKDIEGLVSDIYRMSKGTVILEVATEHFLETLDELSLILSPEAMRILDRKRSKSMIGQYHSFDEWKEIFTRCGFKIDTIKSCFPDKLIIDMWNIGLRPIAHLLIQMTNSLTPAERMRIKKEWVDIFYELFKPLLQLKQTYTSLENVPYLYFKLMK